MLKAKTRQAINTKRTACFKQNNLDLGIIRVHVNFNKVDRSSNLGTGSKVIQEKIHLLALSIKGKAKPPSDFIHTFISSFSCPFLHQKYIKHSLYTRNFSISWAQNVKTESLPSWNLQLTREIKDNKICHIFEMQ